MSKISKDWNVQDVRDVMSCLDEKTGLKGSEALIKVTDKPSWGKKEILAEFGCSRKGTFEFSKPFMDKDVIGAIHTIRHEYCHYAVWTLGLNKVLRDWSDHGKAFKFACAQLNVADDKSYSGRTTRLLRTERVERLMRADDIEPVDILEQAEIWKGEFVSVVERARRERMIAARFGPESLFEVGDVVERRCYGRGVVVGTLPMKSCDKQMLHIRFDDGVTALMRSNWVTKLRVSRFRGASECFRNSNRLSRAASCGHFQGVATIPTTAQQNSSGLQRICLSENRFGQWTTGGKRWFQ